MTGIDGIELLQQLRAFRPIIILPDSARLDSAENPRFGAFDYLRSHMIATLLARTIRRALSRALTR